MTATFFLALTAPFFSTSHAQQTGTVIGWGSVVLTGQDSLVVVSAGGYHNLGLTSDGRVVAWGDNVFGQCNVPEPNRDFIAISAGMSHSLGLRNDWTVVAWGDDRAGQCDVPEPNGDFVAISAGKFHSLGLRSDGSIMAWGNNRFGQCDLPEPNTDFIAIAAGWVHNLGLKSDGTIVAWGSQAGNLCDVPEPNADFIAIAAGWQYGMGLKRDGTIVTWGDNDNDQCDVPSPNLGFIAIAAGTNSSLGIREVTTDPAMLKDLSLMRTADGVRIIWSVTDEANVNAYRLYRARRGLALGRPVETIPADGRYRYAVTDTSARSWEDYRYTLVIVADDGGETILTRREMPGRLPSLLTLEQNRPNPFNPSTRIGFTLPRNGRVHLSVYDVMGRPVTTLLDEVLAQGYREVAWDGTDAAGQAVSSGVYFYRIEFGPQVLNRKMLLVR